MRDIICYISDSKSKKMDFSKIYRRQTKPQTEAPPIPAPVEPQPAALGPVAAATSSKPAGLFAQYYSTLMDASKTPPKPLLSEPVPPPVVAKPVSPQGSLPTSPETLYRELVKMANTLVMAGAVGAPIDPAPLRLLIAQLIGAIKVEPDRFLALALQPKETGALFHMAHLTVFSIFLGIEVGAQNDEISVLGLAALFHDIAMPRFEHIISVPRRLVAQEISEVREHVRLGMAAAESLLAADPPLARSINHCSQFVHERCDGSGYPAGLKGTQIPIGGQIVGMSDTYDAMAHKRSWRESLPPYSVSMHFVRQCGVLFDPFLVKTFLNSFTMFPPGSYVELSSGETAEVVAINKGLLTRPQVRLVGPQGGPADSAILDLRDNQAVHITRQVGCAACAEPFPESKNSA